MSHLLIAIHDVTITEEARQMSAVLLRRIFSNDFMEFYPKLSPENQIQLKQQVILAIQNENQSPQLRNKVCEVAAEVARNLIDDEGNNQWPEFLQVNFIFQSSVRYLFLNNCSTSYINKNYIISVVLLMTTY